jgi:hypothetical protein
MVEDVEEETTGTRMAAAITTPVAFPTDEATVTATATVTGTVVDQVTSTDTEEAVVDTQTDPLVDMVAELSAEELVVTACLTLEQTSRSKAGISTPCPSSRNHSTRRIH